MSQDNVELVRRVYEAFNRRDLDTVLALSHDEVVVESRLVAMEGGYRGPEGVGRWWRNLLGVLPDYKLEIEEVRDLGDVTLARIRAEGHGADSATPLSEIVWQAVRWQDGKYIWWRAFPTEADALKAVGLQE
jgi:ketosteroid isomerase-like protein